VSKYLLQLYTYAELKAETMQLKILSVLLENKVVYLLRANEYSSDWPYAKKISLKL